MSRVRVSTLKGIDRGGLQYTGPSPEGTLYMEHQCSDWVIGTDLDAIGLIAELEEAIEERADILATPKVGILKTAIDNGWSYYCKEHMFGTAEWYGPGGMVEHVKSGEHTSW
jgi:hypothetical protein